MARKRKNFRNKQRRRPAELSAAGNCEAFETRAQTALASERHKDAIVAFKALLKEERRANWVTGLAQAYAGRAAELARKGMFNEALAIWEQRADSCETALAAPNYLIWLLQAGRIDDAVKLFRKFAETSTSQADLSVLREHLAALALAGETGIIEALPHDDPVVRDHGAAEALLGAFCSADEKALDVVGKSISHRSPYRNFRLLLKAWHLGEQMPAEVSVILGRIALHSPFRGLADTLLGLQATTSKSSLALVRAEPSTLALQATMYGWSNPQLEVLKAAAALGPAPNAKSLFNLLVRHAHAFDKQQARSLALRLLVHYEQGRRGVDKAFGRLSNLEQATLDAKLAEQARDAFDMDDSWRQLLVELHELPPTIDNKIRQALVLRHLVDRWLSISDEASTRHQAIDDLSRSLVFDPDDVATRVRLIELQRKCNRLKEARFSIDRALERFPEHTGVLLEAVQTALANNAFKKAAGIAKRLLAIDPINVRVQGILLDAHVAHARKQILTRKFELARRELDTAASWARNPETEGGIVLLRGMLECEAGETKRGRAFLQQGVELCGGALVGQFRLLLEGERLEHDGPDWLKFARLPRTNSISTKEHVLAVMRAVADSREASSDALYHALAPLEPALSEAVREPFSQAEMTQVCEVFYCADLFELLEAYADRARERWPDRAEFGFHYLYAIGGGEIHDLDEQELHQLDKTITRARNEGDERTLHRLLEFTHLPHPFGSPSDFPLGFPIGDPAESFGGYPGEGPYGAGLPPDVPRQLIELLEQADPEELEAFLAELEGDPGAAFDGLPSPGEQTRRNRGKPKSQPKKRGARRPVTNSDQGDLF